MTEAELTELEKEYASKDVRVFNALRELRLELRVVTRAYEDLYKERYGGPVPVFAHVRSS